MNQIIEKIKSALATVLELEDTSHVLPTSKLFDELNLDSTSVIELLMVLEDEVQGLSIDPESLQPAHFETVQSLAEYVMMHSDEATENAV